MIHAETQCIVLNSYLIESDFDLIITLNFIVIIVQSYLFILILHSIYFIFRFSSTLKPLKSLTHPQSSACLRRKTIENSKCKGLCTLSFEILIQN